MLDQVSEPKDQKLPPVEVNALKRSGQSQQSGRDRDFEIMEISWQGPIPPPSVFKQIDEIVPNGAERLFAQFERETKQRHKLHSRAQSLPFIDQVLGRVCALLFAFACYIAAFAIEKGAYLPATVIGGAMIVAGINAFMRHSDARGERKSESQKKVPKKR